ncbi:Uu.00g094650.m01.CDS01 [Anthostomella pinea]|uniref:Uu.00g094650.m01.CDS01 n=1 Tax=Anthostomella pinea TaxID=933095 RepID=A0AAI8YIA2_9PEZI|nr:Uu.00g094650.m01.CDS01 [Anthostomella pinea]
MLGLLESAGGVQGGIHGMLKEAVTVLADSSSDTAKVLEQLRLAQVASKRAAEHTRLQRLLQALGPPGNRYEEVRDATEHTFAWLFPSESSSSDSSDAMSDNNSDRSLDANHSADDATGSFDSGDERSDDGRPLGYPRVTSESAQNNTTGDRRYSEHPPNEEHIRKYTSDRLRRWLCNGTGVLHIAGKPGSGKSTLMKFISEHHVTKRLLSEWAEPNLLVHSKFFFWKPGDWRQNTSRGLIRGLLYDILGNAPSLMPIMFPQWSAGNLAEKPADTQAIRISEKDCFRAFHQMIDARHAREAPYLCFFIDGLDEFDEDADIPHGELVKMLRQWTDQSDGRVKLCVSSRELPVFENISPEDKIRLQELTKGDMVTYATNKLRNNEQFFDLQSADF